MSPDRLSHMPPDEAALNRALFEVMKAHFDAHEEFAAFLADALIEHGLENGYALEVMDKTKDNAALERVDKALLELSRALSDAAITPGARMQLGHALTFGPFVEKLPLKKDSEEGKRLFDYMDAVGRQNAGAINYIQENVDSLRHAVAQAQSTIAASPYAKDARINAQEIGVVDATRFVWSLALKKTPPKTLNEASPFGRFLADVFEACGFSANPRSAFNAWTREQQKVHTSGQNNA